MRAAMAWAVVAALALALPAVAAPSCADCTAAASERYQACRKDAPAGAKRSPECARAMGAAMQACQQGPCAGDVARMYQGYCAGCMQQADTPAKKKQCQESVCRGAGAR